MTTRIAVCLSCGASAEGCRLKDHYSGRRCCPDCDHTRKAQ